MNLNTEKRIHAANDFEKDFFKSMTNSVHEKQWKIYEKESD